MTSSTSEGVVSQLLAQMAELKSRVALLEFDVRNLRAPVQPPAKTKRNRTWTPEQREAQRQRLFEINARKRARKVSDQ